MMIVAQFVLTYIVFGRCLIGLQTNAERRAWHG